MKKIVIIGGGISGLSAANFLVRTGCDVTVLEARSVFGGRVETITQDGALLELGAEFLHGENPSIRNVISAAGLTTEPIVEDYQLFQNGALHRTNLLAKASKIINQVNPQRRDCSFLEYLDSRQVSAEERVQLLGFVKGFHAAHPEKISAHALRRGEYSAEHMLSTQQSRVIEGYSALVSFLEQEIQAHGGKLISEAIVEHMRWQSGRVDVAFQNDDRFQNLRADAAVITLPLGVLKAGVVKFEPSLGLKRDAIEELQFGNVLKVIFQFREQWWPDFGFVVAPDEPFPTWWTTPGQPYLTAWAGGPTADDLLQRSPAEWEKTGLEILARLFPDQAIAIDAQFLSVQYHDWSRDPYTRGAYSYVPVNGLDLPKLLGAPIADTLFFAGEATVTDAQTGTVFGAYETGLRAAREILATIADTSPEAVGPPQK